MAAFRLLNNFPVYFDQQGRPASGGELRFYESGTTTPKDVYGDPDLSVNNGSSVTLDSDGRTSVDVWGDGVYRVRLYLADGTLDAEADHVQAAGGTGQSIPALVSGQFLTNNGALLLWAPIREMPDPTGQDGKYPVASGSGYVLQSPPAPPEIPEPEIVITADTFRAGVSDSSTKYYVQTGTGSAPANATRATSENIEFDTPFADLWHISVTVKTAGVTSAVPAGLPQVSVTGDSVNGFTANFRVNAEEGNGNEDVITSAIPFSWIAFGTITIVDIPVTP